MIVVTRDDAIDRTGQKASQKHEDGDPGTILTRQPTPGDAASVTDLVRSVGTLEPNTTYAYLLLCSHFSQTSALAEREGKLVGCALGYRLPEQPRTLFIWQIGVDEGARRQGVARHLLDELIHRDALSDVAYIETTVAGSNHASRGLFERWAKQRNFELQTVGVFECSLFGPPGSHEQEEILRIGPLLEKL